MTAFVALLRAVNVGGTGKLPMTELKSICEAAGLESVKTYIASGNVVFKSKLTEAKVKAALESALADYAGRPVGVMIRTAHEMAGTLAANPYADKPRQLHCSHLPRPSSAAGCDCGRHQSNH